MIVAVKPEFLKNPKAVKNLDVISVDPLVEVTCGIS